MIRGAYGPGWLRLRGHAGYGPAGQDIVCAAVTILAETLAQFAPVARLGPGEAEFAWGPENQGAAEFALTGLRRLAADYPQCLRLVSAGGADTV